MSVASKGEDARGFRRFGERLREDDGREARVEDRVEVAGNGVKGDEGVEWEVGREVEAEFWVEENGEEDVEVGRVGAGVDVSRRREDEPSAFALTAYCGRSLHAFWRGPIGWWDVGTRPPEYCSVGASATGRYKCGLEGEIAYASVGDFGH